MQVLFNQSCRAFSFTVIEGILSAVIPKLTSLYLRNSRRYSLCYNFCYTSALRLLALCQLKHQQSSFNNKDYNSQQHREATPSEEVFSHCLYPVLPEFQKVLTIEFGKLITCPQYPCERKAFLNLVKNVYRPLL